MDLRQVLFLLLLTGLSGDKAGKNQICNLISDRPRFKSISLLPTWIDYLMLQVSSLLISKTETELEVLGLGLRLRRAIFEALISIPMILNE